MSDWFKVFGEMSLDNLFVISGLVFLGIGVVRKISGKIDPSRNARVMSGLLGVSLMTGGLWIHRGHISSAQTGKTQSSPSEGQQPANDVHASVRQVQAQANETHSGVNGGQSNNRARAVGLPFFSGSWKNVDAETRGLTTLSVRSAGQAVWVHAWGRCHPTDCDWGEVTASAFALGVEANPANHAQKITAVYQTSFSNTLLTLTPSGDDALMADTETRFTDNSGRLSYSATYTFRR